LGNKKEVVSGDAAWEKTGQRMTDAEVKEMRQLEERLKTGTLSSNEENRLFVLREKRISVAHVE